MASTIRGDDNFDSAGPFGHWTSLSSVTLGGSVVSSIAVTLPSGYDVHRMDFRFPMPSSGSYAEPIMYLRNSSNAAQTFTYTRFLSYNNGNSSARELSAQEWVPYVGGQSGNINYFWGSLTIYDALSSSKNTRYWAQGACSSGFYNERMVFSTGGIQNTAGAITSALFEYKNTSFETGSNFYYELYGHTY